MSTCFLGERQRSGEMRTEQCYCVIEAVKTGSFTKAAENLFLKQPSLRANINNLEDELGQPLFERSKSGVKLTSYGEAAYPSILSIIKTYELLKEANNVSNQEEHTLTIGATRVFSGLLGKSYDLYENQYPGKKCVFFSSDSDNEVLQRVIEQKLDLGLISYFPLLWEANKWFHSQKGRAFEMYKLREIQTVAVMRKDHPLAELPQIPLERLEKYLLVFFSDSITQVYDLLELERKKENVKAEPLKITKVTDERLMTKYLMEENAVSFTLDWAIASYPDSLKCVPLDKRFVQQAVAIYSSGLMLEDTMGYINIIKTLIK